MVHAPARSAFARVSLHKYIRFFSNLSEVMEGSRQPKKAGAPQAQKKATMTHHTTLHPKISSHPSSDELLCSLVPVL